MSPAAGPRVRLSADALSQEVGDGLFILHMQQQHYYSLDAVGSRVWTLLREHGDVARTVEQILSEYDVDPDTARADVSNLVNRLAAQGLIVLE
jgi:Coenzyme PQQ synthesis protein D (PqqD)